jgi:HK97 gp10 family phage protein
MSPAISATIDVSEVQSFFSGAPRKFQNALNTGIRAAAFLIEGQTKIKTPVLTGRLRASIYTKVGSLYAKVSTNTNYAFFVHNGTRSMRPRPFMLQGLQAAEYNIKAVFDREIQKALS